MISSRGFSLVELLVAVFVVALSGSSILKLYSFMEVEKSNAAMAVEAKRIAESQIALLHTVNTMGSECAGREIADIQGCQLTLAKNSPFLINIETLNVLENALLPSGTAQAYVYILSVKVSWKDRNSEEKELKLPAVVSISTNLLR